MNTSGICRFIGRYTACGLYRV